MGDRLNSIPNIKGVELHPLKVIGDERGAVLHMLKPELLGAGNIGEVYFSEVFPGAVKAWKKHLHMTQRLAVPVGKIRFVLYDDRLDSMTRGVLDEFILGRPDHYHLLVIEPMIWYGFSAIDSSPALIVNCPDLPHDPDEVEHKSILSNAIPYQW